MTNELKIGDIVTESHEASHKTLAEIIEIHDLETGRFYKVKFVDNGVEQESGLLPDYRLKGIK